MSAALRRLHEEARKPYPGMPPAAAGQIRISLDARRTIDGALPALADMVEAVEGELGLGPARPGKPLTDALDALRERLGAKP